MNYNKIFLGGIEIGYMGIVHPTVSKAIDKKAGIVFAEIDINKFASAQTAPIQYEEPSKYPSIEYDLSMDIPAGVLFGNLRECWKDAEGKLLRRVGVVDTYDTEEIHRITVRLEFGSNERTLSSAEVQEVVDTIISGLAEKGVSIKTA